MKKVIIAIILGWVMIFLLNFNVFSSIEHVFQDKLTTKTREVDSRIKIVAIDQESIAKMGNYPWSRADLAKLIEPVALGGATAVWTDLLLTKETQPEQDQALAKVISQYDNIYLPVLFDFTALQKSQEEFEKEYLKLPIFDIPQDRIGHTNILADSDQVVREILLGIPTPEEEIIPIIDVRMANLLLPEKQKITWNQDYIWQRGQEDLPVNERLRVGFAYASAPQQSKFEVIPAWKVIQGEVSPSYFKDSIILIGLYNADGQEQLKTPMSKIPMNTLEVHANMIQALVDDALYGPAPMSYAIAIVVLVVMFGFFLFDWLRVKWGAVILLVLIAGYSVVFYFIFRSLWIMLPYFYVLFGFTLSYIVASVGKSRSLRKAK